MSQHTSVKITFNSRPAATPQIPRSMNDASLSRSATLCTGNVLLPTPSMSYEREVPYVDNVEVEPVEEPSMPPTPAPAAPTEASFTASSFRHTADFYRPSDFTKPLSARDLSLDAAPVVAKPSFPLAATLSLGGVPGDTSDRLMQTRMRYRAAITAALTAHTD